MTVRAVLADGREVALDAKHGYTIPDVVHSLTAASLTGSAVALADAKLQTADGGEIAYRDVNTFVCDTYESSTGPSQFALTPEGDLVEEPIIVTPEEE